jgi:Phytanoyl-CoA dioxygenase (PhyH)
MITFDAIEPLVDSSPARSSGPTLRDRAGADGYLYFRHLIPEAEIEPARNALLGTAERHGLLDNEGAPAVEAQSASWFDFYADLLGQQSLYALAWSEPLRSVVAAVITDDAIPHPCGIFRVNGRRIRVRPKPAHQDARYVHCSAPLWTAWIACGGCTRATGGIALLPGSHAEGIKDVFFNGVNNEAVVDSDAQWRGNILDPGDVIMFSSYTVHRTVSGLDPKAIRLSVDFRYQSSSEPFSPPALQPHLRLRTWDDIYADWDASKGPGRYYWRNMPIQVDFE